MRVEAKLEELALTLPEPPKLPPGLATLPLGVPVTIAAEVAISS
jgi:hypothetical protein